MFKDSLTHFFKEHLFYAGLASIIIAGISSYAYTSINSYINNKQAIQYSFDRIVEILQNKKEPIGIRMQAAKNIHAINNDLSIEILTNEMLKQKELTSFIGGIIKNNNKNKLLKSFYMKSELFQIIKTLKR